MQRQNRSKQIESNEWLVKLVFLTYEIVALSVYSHRDSKKRRQNLYQNSRKRAVVLLAIFRSGNKS